MIFFSSIVGNGAGGGKLARYREELRIESCCVLGLHKRRVDELNPLQPLGYAALKHCLQCDREETHSAEARDDAVPDRFLPSYTVFSA